MIKTLAKRIFSVMGYRVVPEGLVCLDWRRKLLTCLDGVPPQGLLFLDVGANVGQSSLAVHHALSKETRITCHCFEPISDNFQRLRQRTASVPSIHAYPLAMGEEIGTLTVPLAPNSEWHSIANAASWEGAGATHERIEISTLDDFMADKPGDDPVILKTDTEGYDLQVLKGARRLLESGRVVAVIAEVGFNPEDRQHTFFQGVFDYLGQLGYRLSLIDDQRAYRDPMWNRAIVLGFANAWFVRASP